MDFGASLLKLRDLLNPQETDSSDDEFKPKTQVAKMGPGDIGGRAVSGKEKTEGVGVEDDDVIWSAREVPQGSEFDDTIDPRKEPEYEMFFRQKVTTEDIYLQMGNKNPATFSCEDLVIKIKLPGVTTQNEIHLDVKEKRLDCRTSTYRLGLFLPHPVKPDSSKAEWDQNSHNLTIILRLDRELDELNF
ncbi:dynein axonemal assembly factor 6 [Centruroides vittatus]|uniref:dynein axonemal assembly factor 6 n=1 Tax=Centruroides vittatus TaxID=120091 RepID=UPI00350EC1B6